MKRVLEYGEDLISGRENVPGFSTIKSQLDSIIVRWEKINKASRDRLAMFEEVVSLRYEEEINKLTIWITKKESEVHEMDKQKRKPANLDTYIQVRGVNNHLHVSIVNILRVLLMLSWAYFYLLCLNYLKLPSSTLAFETLANICIRILTRPGSIMLRYITVYRQFSIRYMMILSK